MTNNISNFTLQTFSMNHPPKKKNKNPLLPENNQVDERNLINLEDSASLSFEDRVNIYWQENKGFLIGCILVLVLVTVGYQGMRLVKEQMEVALQNKYAEADASGTLAEFARAHDDKPLGGFAALTIADQAYNDEDFETAHEFYTLAVSALDEPVLAGRARIGQAFALYKTGKVDEGLALLNAITSDNTLAESIRIEAAYHLAIEAYTADQEAEFSSYASQIKDSKFAGQWQQRLQSLPKLKSN